MDIKKFIFVRLGTQLVFLLVGIALITLFKVDVSIEGIPTFYAVVVGSGLGGVVFLLVLSLCRMSNSVGESLRVIVRNTHRVLGTLTFPSLLSLSVAAGVCEEILFRGAIFGGLLQYLGVFPALVISSVVFAALHFRSRPVFIFTLVYGFILGSTYRYTESLILVTAWHFVYDFLALAFIVYRPSVFIPQR